MSKIKDELDQLNEDTLERLEAEYLETPEISNFRSSNIILEEQYNAKFEFENYLSKLEDNVEIFNTEEIEKLKTEEAFNEFLKLTEDQKKEFFPLSYIEEIDTNFKPDFVDDIFIEDEIDTNFEIN